MNSIFFNANSRAWRPLAFLIAGILAVAATFAALVLLQAHDRQRLGLDSEAKTRAAFASQYVDQALRGLARTLTLLPSTALTDESTREAFYTRARQTLDGTGVTLIARDKNFSPLLSSAGTLALTGDELNGMGRQAAEKAVRDRRPQLSSYGTGSNDRGENLWIAIAGPRGDTIVIQARIPASYFASTLQSIASTKSWFLAIVQSDGRFLARYGDDTSFANFKFSADATNASPFAQSLAEASEFGWRVGAATPFLALGTENTRNWSWYILIMSLLTMLSVAGSYSVLQKVAQPSPVEQLARQNFPASSTNSPRKAPSTMPVDRLRSVLEAGGIGTWEWRHGERAITGDDKAAELIGLPRGSRQMAAMGVLRKVASTDRTALLLVVRSALSEPHHISQDVKFKGFDGTFRWLAVRGTTAAAEGGRQTGVTGIVYDITEQKQSAAKTNALLREVSHRTKNLLALILAMARLTARDNSDVKTHLKQFALRVAGLSASQDVIVAADWQNADLAALARGEVEAVARAHAPRVALAGPSVVVTPEAAQTLGIIIAELTLNAIEHGALSTPSGRVQLLWDIPDPGTFRMSWRETGGLHYDPTKPKRYGMTIIERLAVQGLKATLEFGSGPDGFRWTLEAPLPGTGAPAREA